MGGGFVIINSNLLIYGGIAIKKDAFQRGKSKSRIDLTLVGCDTANKVISRKISNCHFSDHHFNIIKLKTNGI
jgi:hypothetical protein